MATLKDISKVAGVSMMTVSRAYNDPEKVKSEVRDMIMKIGEEMGYIPNHAAKSLATKKTGIIKIITHLNPEEEYFAKLLAGAAGYLSENGYSIMISKDKQPKYQHDGVIIMGLGQGEDAEIANMIKKPFVLFGKSDAVRDWVDIDNRYGMAQITDYLIGKGHTSIGYIGIKSHEQFAAERQLGFMDAMKENGLSVSEDEVITLEHTLDAVREVAPAFLERFKGTAVVCASDTVAYGLIEAAKTAGIQIPEELSIVGFDGSMFSQMSNPKITTMIQPVYDVGVMLAKTLISRIDNPKMPAINRLIRTELSEAESVEMTKYA